MKVEIADEKVPEPLRPFVVKVRTKVLQPVQGSLLTEIKRHVVNLIPNAEPV